MYSLVTLDNFEYSLLAIKIEVLSKHKHHL